MYRMIHTAIAVAVCIPLLVLNFPWPACYWPAAFYIGRELAQAEFRYIEAYGRHRSDCPWYCGFLPASWTLKGIFDFLLPLAVSTAFASFATF